MPVCKVCGCQNTRWLRVSQVAAQFRCSEKKVRRMIKEGEVHAVLFGRQWRVDHASLDAFVRAGAEKASIRRRRDP